MKGQSAQVLADPLERLDRVRGEAWRLADDAAAHLVERHLDNGRAVPAAPIERGRPLRDSRHGPDWPLWRRESEPLVRIPPALALTPSRLGGREPGQVGRWRGRLAGQGAVPADDDGTDDINPPSYETK